MVEPTGIDAERAKQILEQNLPLLQERYNVHSLGLFGSYVRREQTPESDLDILVTFSETPGLLQFVALENHLSDLLGIQVDLVMRDALKPHLGQRILREVVSV
jgi:predicted nucleotidyltransferase